MLVQGACRGVIPDRLVVLDGFRVRFSSQTSSSSLNLPHCLEEKLDPLLLLEYTRSWQHPIWPARQRQRTALAQLQQEQSKLSPQTTHQLYRLFSRIEAVLAADYQPPGFTHGDCHAHQFYLYRNEVGTWMVSGCVDLEVASAGDSIQDLVKIVIEMVREFAGRDWWTPLFAGYGKEPNFDAFRLRLLCASEEELQWPGTRQEVLDHVLQARNWADAFTFERTHGMSSNT